MNISVVIPAYNEEKRIEPSLSHIINYLESRFDEFEVIIVDDGSNDRTCEIVSNYKNRSVRIITNNVNKGKGYSVKIGIMNAQYQLVLFSDSDLATPIEELEGFIGFIDNDFDIVMASRNLKDSDIRNKQPFYRQVMGKTFPKIVNTILLGGFKDTQCGFKLFKTDAAKRIVQLQTINGFSFDVELLFIARKMGYKIKEAPVVWIDKEGSTVRTIKDGINMLIDLCKIKYNDLSGIYFVNK